MKKYLSILSACPLFKNISSDDLLKMIACLNGKAVTIGKGQPVFLEGEPAQLMGILLTGTVQIIQSDYYGNRNVLSILQPGEYFGEVFPCANLKTLPVSVFAQKESTILLLDLKRILTVCSNACSFHNQLIRNLLQGIAEKNLAFTNKIRYMSHKTTKEKLLSYLSDQAKLQKSAEFFIPLDRQSLADYLGVERTAMSTELNKLKKAGIIDTRGSWFHMIKNPNK